MTIMPDTAMLPKRKVVIPAQVRSYHCHVEELAEGHELDAG